MINKEIKGLGRNFEEEKLKFYREGQHKSSFNSWFYNIMT